MSPLDQLKASLKTLEGDAVIAKTFVVNYEQASKQAQQELKDRQSREREKTRKESP